MSAGTTALADVVIPSKFLPYMIERTAQLSAFVQSGIVVNDPEFNELVEASGGVNTGSLITMPFWVDIKDASQILSDSVALTTNKITSNSDITAKQGRGNSWSANQLAPLLIDGDPLSAVANLMAAYWMRADQTMLIAMLKGVFLASDNSMTSNTLNIFTEDGVNADENTNTLNGITIMDACQLLGDAKGKLSGIACHSAVMTWLSKQDLIEFMPDSEGKPTIPYYQGKRVIEDDSLPVRAGTTSGYVYTTYLFGEGAFAQGEKDLIKVPVDGGFGSYGLEMARTAGVGNTLLYSRRIFLLHPRGVKWNAASCAGKFPTDTELALGTNWSRVYEAKNVRLVQVNHNIL